MRWCANAKEVGGGDTTVVLAHGYGANQSLWDKLLPALSEHHRVILFDWDFTGAGDDEEAGRYTFGRFADDLIALMDDKGVRGAVVVGHSMSAMAACIASVRRPDLFAHLVLLCASPRYGELATPAARHDRSLLLLCRAFLRECAGMHGPGRGAVPTNSVKITMTTVL